MQKLRLLLFILIVSCSGEQKPWLGDFEKTDNNPILRSDSSSTWLDPITKKDVRWQKADVFNPAAVVYHDTLFVLYRAEDNPKAYLGGRTSRIGLAYSTDGINFSMFDYPVLYPDSSEYIKWDYPGGTEDPRIVQSEDGVFIMTYTSWNQDVARLSVATSTNLRNWQKQGPAFEEAYEGRFADRWSKSGSIITERQGENLIAKKINDKYWMYWGDTDMFLATSTDLKNWEPVLTDDGELLRVMKPRAQKFDSRLVEPGPPALITDDGILVLYNGMNADNKDASADLASGTYCAGQALFDINNPGKLIGRMDGPFLCPSLPHEITGQYQAGTTFIEGLVFYKEKWRLFYGTADSMVGLAVAPL